MTWAPAFRFPILPCVATLAWLVTAASTTGAQTAPQDLGQIAIEDLMDVTITTASPATERAGTAPARVNVVTADQIARRGYRSLLDVLRDLPDIKIDIGGDQDWPVQITVQGTRGTSRVLVLLDGIRISSPTNEPLPIMANYPVHAARQIEVVYLFLTVENAFDRRYRHINLRAFENPEEMIGAPQNPRRLTVGATIAVAR